MFLFFKVYAGQWLTQVTFYSVLDSEYCLISFKTWFFLLIICFLFHDGVCSTPPNVLLMYLSDSFYLGNTNKDFCLNFKRALWDITTEKVYYVLESFCQIVMFCQNVEVVPWFIYMYIYIYICIYIYIYIYIYIFLVQIKVSLCDSARF